MCNCVCIYKHISEKRKNTRKIAKSPLQRWTSAGPLWSLCISPHVLCQNVPSVWQSRMTNKESCLHSLRSLLRLDCHCSNLDPRIRDGERPNVSLAPNGSKWLQVAIHSQSIDNYPEKTFGWGEKSSVWMQSDTIWYNRMTSCIISTRSADQPGRGPDHPMCKEPVLKHVKTVEGPRWFFICRKKTKKRHWNRRNKRETQ